MKRHRHEREKFPSRKHISDAKPNGCFRGQGWLLVLLLAVLVVIAYQPAWNAGFIWDDDVYVTDNELLSAPDGLKRIWFSTDSPSQYFPLTYTSFRVEYSLWGLDASGYHWVNILLHAVNAVLVWLLLRRLNVPGAWLAAALFALHPVQVESVAWITERKNVLSLLFYLLALLAWVRFVDGQPARLWRLYGLALVFYMLALFSKTTACTLPAALLLVLWLKRQPITRVRLLQILPFVTLGLAMGLLTIWWERHHQGTAEGMFAIGPVERALIASRAIWFYLGKLIWPANLMFSYPRWTIDAGDVLAYGWLLAGAGMGAAIYLARRFLGRGLEVTALFYVAALSPLLGFIMLYTFRYSFVADHYQYAASIGPLALAAAGITLALNRFVSRKVLVHAFVGAVLIATLGTLTWRQARIYRNSETLWRDTLARNPESWIAWGNLGLCLWADNKVDEAIGCFRTALDFQPLDPDVNNNLADCLMEIGQWEEAILHYRKVLKVRTDANVQNNLGTALLRSGRADDAIVHIRQSLETYPQNPSAYNNLGTAYRQHGDEDQAVLCYQKALELQPNFAEPSYNLANIFLRRGDLDRAARLYRKAAESQPGFTEAHINLASIFKRQSRWDLAAEHYTAASRLAPRDTAVLGNLAFVLEQKGQPAEAAAQYRQIVAINPQDAVAHFRLALLLARAGQKEGAETHVKEALRLRPDLVEASQLLEGLRSAQGISDSK